MASSNQILEVTKSLTTAADCQQDTRLLMQPYANWEEYLTPAPMSIAILSELIFISSNTDFSIRKGGPEGGFQYIKYPDSFRACLMQVCNSGWRAFNDAHKNMDQIRLYTNNVPNYIKTAVQILLQDDDNIVQTMLPAQLKNIRVIADDCLHLAQSTEKRFNDVIELIQELLETCTSAKQVYGDELEEVRKKIHENELRRKAAEEATKRAEEAMKNMSKQLEEAQKTFDSAMDSMPSDWDIVGMNFVEGLTNTLFTHYSAVASKMNEKADTSTMEDNSNIDQQQEEKNPTSEINIYAKSSYILALVDCLKTFLDGDQIKWSEITDQKTKKPKTDWAKEQVVKIENSIKKEKECKPKNEALELCTNVISICSKLEKFASKAEFNDAETKNIAQVIKSLGKEAVSFDTKSKSATNTSAFNVIPPQLAKTGENSSGSKSAGQIAADNARFKIEQNRVQLEKARESYEKHFNNMEENKKALDDILVMMRNCEVKKIDFNTTIKILAQGLEAMGNVKDQWQKLVHFFQMVSNLMETCLNKSLKDFAETTESSSEIYKYSSSMFLKDMIYNQAFYASNIAGLVNMIAGTYTEVSDKYLMDGVSRLSKLMSLDVNHPQFLTERLNTANSCKEAEEGISNLVKKNKQNFEMETKQRLEKIESGLKAVLPPESEEKEKERKEIVERASKNNQYEDQYA